MLKEITPFILATGFVLELGVIIFPEIWLMIKVLPLYYLNTIRFYAGIAMIINLLIIYYIESGE